MFERFTDRARRVVVLAQDEARMLNHDYIGTEHILLGLIREGDGVAAQVLVRMGADLNRVRQQVIQLLEGHQGEGAQRAVRRGAVTRDHLLTEVQNTLATIAERLTAIERHLGLAGRPESPDVKPASPDKPAAGDDKPAAGDDKPAPPDDKPASGE